MTVTSTSEARRAGERVMESISHFIEKVLKLKVNRNKSAVDRPSKRKFLGFSFYIRKGKVRNYIPKKPIQRFKSKGKGNHVEKQWKKHGNAKGKTQLANNRLGQLLSNCRHGKGGQRA